MKLNKVRLSGGFQNDVFYLEKEKRVQRISSKKKTREMVQQEIEWKDYLYQNGIAVPKPDMNLEISDERVVTYFEFIDGEPIDVTNTGHWNLKRFEEFGKILGRIHSLSKGYKVETIHRPKWTAENPDVFDISKGLSREIREKYEHLLKELTAYKITPDTFGLIHNDFHQGNLIINREGTAYTIDFDDCSYNWFAQDIAVFFYHAYWQQGSFIGETETFCHEFLKHFLSGYQAKNTLDPVTIRQIPVFLKLREIFLYQLFLRTWDRNHLEEWQVYTLNDLEMKIKNDVPYAGIKDFNMYL